MAIVMACLAIVVLSTGLDCEIDVDSLGYGGGGYYVTQPVRPVVVYDYWWDTEQPVYYAYPYYKKVNT